MIKIIGNVATVAHPGSTDIVALRFDRRGTHTRGYRYGKVMGEQVWGQWVRTAKADVFYVCLQHLNSGTPKASGLSCAIMWSGAQPRPDDGISYWQAFRSLQPKWLDPSGPWCDNDWPKTKISGEHHIHYVPSEIIKVSDRKEALNRIAYELKGCDSLSVTAVAGIMLFAACCGSLELIAFTHILACSDTSNVVSLLASLKHYSESLKQWQHVSGRYE